MNNLPKLRFENKYLLSKNVYYRLINSIKQISYKDSNSSVKKTYKVRSLYYDNKDFNAYVDKINGNNIRDKFRIRTYEIDESKILNLKLEMKSRIGQLVYKISDTIAYKDLKIFEKEKSFIKKKGLAIELFLYNFYKFNLQPTTLVEYDREAYFSKKDNVRFTFDHNVKYAFSKNLLLSEDNFKNCYKDAIIFEIKSFQNDLGWVSNIIRSHGLKSEPNSKYAKSVEHTVNNIWY